MHRVPRATGDIDLWVKRDSQKAGRIMKALERFGAPTLQVTAEDFQELDIVYQIGVVPRRIDILISIDGVEFEDAWVQRVEVTIEGLSIPVIGRAHLMQNK